MSDDQFQQYLNGRFKEMLRYYDRQAVQCKRGYRLCSLYVIVAALVLSPLVALDLGNWRPLVALLSASIAAAAALQAQYKFHDNWLRYRATWDRLKREHALHQTGIGEYRGDPDPNALFVKRVEELVRSEGEAWLTTHAADEQSPSQSANSGQNLSGRPGTSSR